MPNPETYNLRQLINNHFFDRDQTKEILENFVTVNNGVLHVGLPEPTNIALMISLMFKQDYLRIICSMILGC